MVVQGLPASATAKACVASYGLQEGRHAKWFYCFALHGLH